MKIITKNIKLVLIIVFSFLCVTTCIVTLSKPQMHKMFSFDVIDYFVKINADGTSTTTKQVTTTSVKGN